MQMSDFVDRLQTPVLAVRRAGISVRFDNTGILGILVQCSFIIWSEWCSFVVFKESCILNDETMDFLPVSGK